MAKTQTEQNDGIREYLKSIGASTDCLDNLPTVEELLAAGNNPFEFEGPQYRPDLGAYSQVFTDDQAAALTAKGYLPIPDGVRCKGVLGGRFMFCPSKRHELNVADRVARINRANAADHTDGGVTYRNRTTRQVSRDEF